jgi:hypothetical protein
LPKLKNNGIHLYFQSKYSKWKNKGEESMKKILFIIYSLPRARN